VATASVAKGAALYSVPAVMKATAASGAQGALFAKGGAAAIVQHVGMVPLGPCFIGAAVGAGVIYGAYRYHYQHPRAAGN
jgi:hypothetical protein